MQKEYNKSVFTAEISFSGKWPSKQLFGNCCLVVLLGTEGRSRKPGRRRRLASAWS
jgi:hypothetical protein